MPEQIQIPEQISNVGDKQMVASLVTLYATGKVRLYQASFVPTPASIKGDFVAAVATFTGYADAVPTYSAVGLGADGNYAAISSRMFFQATDAVTPNTIGGAWAEDAAGNLIGYYPFRTPVNLVTADAFMALTISLRYRESSTADVES